ncbi:MAG: polyprenyl synthetase family protein, partial [Oscillospiraceae bacterium]|nr:polyprenyl synthetase family protein [Oscillospiraceae bacterium]
LAGDALQNLAFEVIGRADIDDTKKIKLINTLSDAVGVYGMIGGQTIDIKNTEAFSKEKLLAMYGMKTGALITAACKMGCICASEESSLAEEYGRNLGLAYQIIDDILDITSDEQTLGKPINSDREQNKATFPEVFGLDEAYKAAKYYTAQALYAARSMPNCEELYEFTKSLLIRKN